MRLRDVVHVASVGAANARSLATESATAMLAPEYRPKDLGDGRVALSYDALDAARELGEYEDGSITDDGEGLRVWVDGEPYDLEPLDG